ncbi:hypothetical protein AXW67_31160 [Bradyrhizobium neotropicale]|uniref:Uncharacterized protein n=1 Tax=Bradyrhizobium neotropicale TaxID=1497615 RepID=A0A176YLQ7_9BRAD|nr:hypothetical protein AXW67_31160 [Bradyrhizobium neotropicale]
MELFSGTAAFSPSAVEVQPCRVLEKGRLVELNLIEKVSADPCTPTPAGSSAHLRSLLPKRRNRLMEKTNARA